MTESLPTSPVEVKIRLKHRDWEVEITCLESKVKQVVEHVLSSIDIPTITDPNLNAQITELKKEIDSLKLRITILHLTVTFLVPAIRKYGALNGLSTETYKTLHKYYIKNSYRSSNRKEVMRQLINSVSLISTKALYVCLKYSKK